MVTLWDWKKMHTLGRKESWDEWEQHFINVFNEHIGKEKISLITLNNSIHDKKIIAVIVVKRNYRGPTYLDPKEKSEFYIRSGTTTQLLNSRETHAYIENHW